MSAVVEEQLSDVQQEGSGTESSKKPHISYSIEFLLSFSELEFCKKLPKDFDESLLSEFHETSYYGTQERPQAVGSSTLPGFRRTDYSSSPPARGDSSNFSRGLQRWDSRSSGRSDGDVESEPGRRYGTQARRSWQNSEHDGLLGSGSFPRPPGYTVGPVARFRPPNENIHLIKSNEPYHPPRPYKAVPHARRDTHDSFNDETFGSTDSTSKDRVEEEKKRRAEFELMRKEAHKAFQEKQKSSSSRPNDSFSDIAGLLDNPSDTEISRDLDKAVKEAPQDDAGKLPPLSQAAPIRPLVPPGFVSSVVDKNSASKPSVDSDLLQIKNLEPLAVHQDVKGIAQERAFRDLHHETAVSSDFKAHNGLLSITGNVDQMKEILEDNEVLGLDSNINRHKVLGEAVHSASILEKILGNTSTANSGIASVSVEGHDPKADDIWSPDKLQSKFARWFREEENKMPKGVSSEKPSSLLSLIIGGEKDASGGPYDLAAEERSGGPNGWEAGSILSHEMLLGPKSTSVTGKIPEQFGISNVLDPKPSVLTCEDLEQSILLEIGGDVPNSLPPEKKDVTSKVKDVDPGTAVDNLASQHLLSLLQRGISSNNGASVSSLEERYPEDREVGKLPLHDGGAYPSDFERLNSSDKKLTLESLFGTAFMNELHSAHRNSVASARMDVSDGTIFPSKHANVVGHDESSILASNDAITNMDKVADWLGIKDAGKEVEFSSNSKFSGFDEANGVKLPQEDSFTHLTGPISSEKSFWAPNSSSFNADLMSSSSNMPDDVIGKLSSHGAIKNESSIVTRQDPPFLQGPYDMGKPEPPYQNLHPQASSPQLHTSLVNHGRELFHPLDSHPAQLDPHLKFIPPEAVIHRDAPIRHQFSANLGHPSFPHPNPGLPGFDRPVPPPMLQQMHMAGNLPPPHLVRGFPGATPMPPHPSHNPAGFIQEHNPVQGFPFGQRQPNFGGPGMPSPGPELGLGNNPPEAFQRLLEMEMRANPKQMQPFGNGSPGRAMYGHELDMGFRYR